jgi:SRSO17 transposase
VWTEEDRTVAAGHSVDPGRWLAELDDLLGCVAARMCRVEPRLRLRRFVLGMMAGLPRTNCWSLAEHAGEACPRGMQRLLSSASWDADRVLRDVRDWVVSRLGEPGGILVIDETGDLKKGAATVGVQRQYTGTAGRIESSQVVVYLTYACGQSDKGHALMDRALYLPKSWTGDVQRMAAAGVPAEVGFATKPALAQAMISDALDAGVPASWVAADEGERWYDWALVDTIDPPADPPADPRVDPAADPADPPAPPAGAGAGQHWLLIRRSRTTGEHAFYRADSPTPVPVATLVKVAGRRWTIEESFAAGKELAALDEHQVRTWTSWQRWTALAILAHAFLSVMAATEPPPAEDQNLIRLTRNEIRRLLAAAIAPVHDIEHVIHWSTWRRQHQARARTSHYARRAADDG